jgi:transcriptional regulator with XRE-family HTH domain
MDLQRAARAFRAVRQHQRLRQADVADRAGVSQQHVSDFERGKLGSMTAVELERLLEALDIRSVLTVSWRGGELDRLLDEGHAAVGGVFADRLQFLGWEVLTEVTFSIYGERGSIDLLAWHPATRTLLVIEIKTEITSAEETLRRHDAKVRLAPRICRERFGSAPAAIGRLLVVADTSANRARVARVAQLLDGAYPARGHALRRWIARPTGAMGGLLFLDTARGGGKKVRPKRVRSGAPLDTARGGGTARRRV